MTARTLPLALVALLLIAAPAAAKGVSEAAVCGAEGCRDITEQTAFALMQGGLATDDPRTTAPWFEVRVTIEHGGEVMDRFAMRWLPEQKKLRGPDGVWIDAPAAVQTELTSLTDGLEPHGATTEVDDGGPSALAIAAPAALILLGGGALAARRRRRG